MSNNVTIRDVYDLIEKLDAKLERRFTRVEERVDELENFKSMALGMFAVIGLFTGGLISWVWRKITGE